MTASDRLRREAQTRERMATVRDPINMLRIVADRSPSHDAMVHFRNADDLSPVRLDYAALAEQTARLGAALQGAGIKPNHVVAIVAPSIPECMIAIMAASSVAIAFPVNLLLGPEAMASQFALANVRAVIAFGANDNFTLDEAVAQAIALAGGVELVIEIDGGSGRSGALQRCSAQYAWWPDLLGSADPATVRIIHGDRSAALFHTGGTTGAPKLADLSLDGLMASVHASAAGIGWRSDDRVLQLLPFFHVGGGVVVGMALFSTGSTLLNCGLAGARDRQTVNAIWEISAREKVTVIALVPPTWSHVAELGKPALWPELRALVTGATSIGPSLMRCITELTGIPLSQVLGMTELSGAGGNQPLDGIEYQPAIGTPTPLVETQLVPIVPGGPDELYVRGPMLFRGYRTVEGLIEHPKEKWHATGDLAEMTSDGQIRLIGRSKDVIIRSGHNIDPQTIEETICHHPAVAMAAAVGMPDAYAGQVPVLFVTRKPGALVEEEELIAFVTQHIEEPPARPKRILLVNSLPLTAVGKIARFQLRQQAVAMRAVEELAGLSKVLDISCTDIGARNITVIWSVDPDDKEKREAENLLAPFELNVDHGII
ncbi:AMP-binding protein [Sphingobium chungangianum]